MQKSAHTEGNNCGVFTNNLPHTLHLLCSLLYPKYVKQCLAHRWFRNISGTNERTICPPIAEPEAVPEIAPSPLQILIMQRLLARNHIVCEYLQLEFCLYRPVKVTTSSHHLLSLLLSSCNINLIVPRDSEACQIS